MTDKASPERPSSFKDRVKQEREQEILATALDVFAEHGFEKASLDHIAERVGIGKGTIYLHFAGKEDILLALMQHASEGLVTTCREHLTAEGAALDKLRAVLRCLVDHRFANDRLVRIVVCALPLFLGHQHRTGASSPLRCMIAELIADGQARGEINPRVRSQMAAAAMLTLVFVGPFVDGERPTTKEELFASAEQLYFHGITKEVDE